MIFYVDKEHRKSVEWAMNGLIEIPFKFEDDGASVMYFAAEEYET